MGEIKSFNIDSMYLFQDDNNVDFAMAEIYFLAEGNNSHRCPISLEVLKDNSHTALGKFIIAKFDEFENDVKGHEYDQTIIGYVPPESVIEFKEKDGKIFAVCKAVISKIYAVDTYNLFTESNHRFVSCEFTATENSKNAMGDTPITSFNIHGITVLGLKYRPSCAGTEMRMTKFSEKCANEYFMKFENKEYKVNKEILKDTPWGDIDKTQLRNNVMSAKNRNTLVKDVYAKVEDGWETAPSENLKYPIMELVSNTFYYNRHALSSALGYAKAENDNEVVNKIEKLYKKFNLEEENKKGAEEKMSKKNELEFAVVDNTVRIKNFGELNGRILYSEVIKKVQAKLGKGYYVEAIYDTHIVVRDLHEDKMIDIPAKIKVGKDDEEMKIDIDFDKQRESKVQKDFSKKGLDEDDAENDKKDATPVDKADVEEDDDKEDGKEYKKKKASKKSLSNDGNVDMAALVEMLKNETEEYKSLIMPAFENDDKATIMRELVSLRAKCSELEKYAKKFEDDLKLEKVGKIMESVKEELSEEEFKELEKEGMECKYSEIKNFEYKVGFKAYEGSKRNKEKETEMRFGYNPQYKNSVNKNVKDAESIYSKYSDNN